MILTTIDQFQEAVPTAAGADIEDFNTFIESAEYKLKKEVLGSALYATLKDAEDDEHTDIIKLCRNVIGLDAFYSAIPFLDVRLDGKSFAVVNNQNLAPASKERVNKLKEATKGRYEDELDRLVQYLEDTTTYHSEWKASDEYSIAWECLVPTARKFNDYIEISGRKLFNKLRPIMKKVQRTIVADAISLDYLDVLVEKNKADNLGSADIAIFDDLCRAIAFFTFAEGINDMAVKVDENGIGRTYSIGDESFADRSMLLSLNERYAKSAKDMMARVVTYMDNNITSFSDYAESSEYTAKNTAGFENTTDSKGFASLS